MKLNYRGIPYEPGSPCVQEAGTEYTGHFLGQTFPIKAGIPASRFASATALCYRGINYLR